MSNCPHTPKTSPARRPTARNTTTPRSPAQPLRRSLSYTLITCPGLHQIYISLLGFFLDDVDEVKHAVQYFDVVLHVIYVRLLGSLCVLILPPVRAHHIYRLLVYINYMTSITQRQRDDITESLNRFCKVTANASDSRECQYCHGIIKSSNTARHHTHCSPRQRAIYLWQHHGKTLDRGVAIAYDSLSVQLLGALQQSEDVDLKEVARLEQYIEELKTEYARILQNMKNAMADVDKYIQHANTYDPSVLSEAMEMKGISVKRQIIYHRELNRFKTWSGRQSKVFHTVENMAYKYLAD